MHQLARPASILLVWTVLGLTLASELTATRLWHRQIDSSLDFNGLEVGRGDRHLHPVAAIQGIRVQYESELDCVRDELQRAVDAFNRVDRAGIRFELDPVGSAPFDETNANGSLWGDPTFWSASDAPRVRILVVDSNVPHGVDGTTFVPLSATGAIYSWDPTRAWVYPGEANGALPRYAVLTLRRSNYSVNQLANCSGLLPSAEVIAHELAHALGFGEQRFMTDASLSMLQGPTAVPNVFTRNSPSRRGGIFKLGAYAQSFLRHYYPANGTDQADWVAHDEVLRRDPLLADRRVIPLSIYQFAEINPEHLIYGRRTQRYQDCVTREAGRWYVQVSEVARTPPNTLCTATTQLQVFLRGPGGDQVLAADAIPNPCDAESNEYQHALDAAPTRAQLTAAGYPIPTLLSPVQVTVGARINPGSAASEWNPDDNEVLTQVVLHDAETTDPRCARTKEPAPGTAAPVQVVTTSSPGRGQHGRSIAATKTSSGSNQVVAVGAPHRNNGLDPGGRVDVTSYRPNGTIAWTTAISAPPTAGGDSLFGRAVALDRNGTRLAVGAPGRADGDGAVYIYTRTGNASTYTLAQTITPSLPGLGGGFGASVALTRTSNNGLLFVGVPNGATANVAAYRWTGTSYGGVAGFTAGTDATAGDRFGYALAATDDWLVVGAPGSSAQAPRAGAAFAFPLNLANVSPIGSRQRLATASAATGDDFGQAVSVDNAVLVVGAPGRNRDRGAAYVYGQPYDRRYLPSWDQRAILNANGARGGAQAGDRFGAAVDNYRGNLLIGAPQRDLNIWGARPLSNAGAAFLFRPRITDNFSIYRGWTGFGNGDRAAGDRYGQAVALGPLFWLTGAPRADIPTTDGAHRNAGAVRRGPYRTLNWYW